MDNEETPFEKSVFINCPFDEHYFPLLRPILFTIYYSGLYPRIALESLDCGKTRIEKIIALIQETRFAIHDLSRIKSTKSDEDFRMNMPFELGLDTGCRLFKGERWQRKKCLILEADHYRYRAALSDISGSDIAVHNDQPEEVVCVVRNWLTAEAGITDRERLFRSRCQAPAGSRADAVDEKVGWGDAIISEAQPTLRFDN